MGQALLAERDGQLFTALNVKRQIFNSQRFELVPGRHAQPDPQAGDRVANARGQLDRSHIATEIVGLRDFQRPQLHIVRGSIFAGGLFAFDQLAAQHGAARNVIAFRQAALRKIRRSNRTTAIEGIGARKCG